MESWEQTSEEQIKQKQKAEENKTFWKGLGCSVLILLFGGVTIGFFVWNSKAMKDHLNVVIENKDGKLLVEDINTKEQRILILKKGTVHEKDQPYIFPGDTINVRVQEKDYQYIKIFNGINKSVFRFNRDSIYARKQRALFNAEKQQIMKQR